MEQRIDSINKSMNFLGRNLWGTKAAALEDPKPSGQRAFSYDDNNDADRVVQDLGGGTTGTEYTFTQVPAEEVALVTRYREMALDADIDEAVGEIKNEIFVFNEGARPFDLGFVEGSKVSESIKAKVHDEFITAYRLLDFNKKGIQWFENWYVDSKIVFQKVFDADKPKEGIQRIIALDPLNIRKIRQLPKTDPNGMYDPSQIKEYYIYTPQTRRSEKTPEITTIGWSTHLQGLQIAPQDITYVDSGLRDRRSGKTVGYLFKAIAPYNQLRGMEDAMMIYRLARAPSRRAFYIDVSALGKTQSEQYIKDLMRRYSSKVTYDPSSGALVNKKSVLSITEDYWLPRREGKNTEITTIDGQDTTNVLEEVVYYRKRMYGSLGVPRARFTEEGSSFNFGKGVEIDRDEYRFRKLLDRMRSQFMNVFLDILRTNLVAKNIIETDEWEDIAADLLWRFEEDNAFVEWKEAEVINSRLATMRDASDLIGKYVSSEWAARTILKMTDDEIKLEKKLIAAERLANKKLGLEDGEGEGGGYGGTVDIPPEAGPIGDEIVPVDDIVDPKE